MAPGIQRRDDRVGDRPFVEAARTLLRDAPQRLGERRIAQDRSRRGGLSAREVQRQGGGVGLHFRLTAGDEVRQDLAHGVSVGRQPDRRRENLFTRQASVVLVKRKQAGHFSWYADDP
jgi:hypothetical protein